MKNVKIGSEIEMEEMNLTDEIIKALEFKAKYDAKIAYVDGCACKHIRVADILDIIRSFQQRVSILEADNDDYKMKIAENELVSIDWHYEQVIALQDENNRLSQKAIELEVETNNQKAEIERLKKQIEKMARDFCNAQYRCNEDSPCCKECILKGDCIPYEYARVAYNAGYRKIHENEVVLTAMETEQQFEDLMVAFDEMGFMPNTTHPFPEEYVETWKQRLIFVFGQLRKETAEKFAEMVKRRLYEYCEVGVSYDEFCEANVICDDIYEICKEIKEGKANASKAELQERNKVQDCSR